MSKWFCCAAAIFAVLIPQMLAQGPRPAGSPLPPPVYSMPSVDISNSPNTLPTQFERQVQAQMEHDRQLALQRDTKQLLEMASELKQNVEQTNPNILSLDVVKKAERIEKLAKSIREKMKGN